MSTETFVEQLYNKFLFRASDEAGKNDWVNRIDGGELSPAKVTYNFAMSQEYSERASAVSELYFLLFGRVPDSQGMQHWLDRIDEGLSLFDLATTFMASQEYHNIYAAAESDEEFLQLLLQQGLGRDVTDGDSAWLTMMAGDPEKGRATIVRVFAGSGEMDQAHGTKIQQTSLYYGLLDRAPTDEELSVAPDDPIELINTLYSDSDYQGEPPPAFTPLPIISISADQESVTESNTVLTFTVTRSESFDRESSVKFEASGLAKTSADDEFISSDGVLTFSSGETSKQIYVQLLDDEIPEQDVVTGVTLSYPQNAELSSTAYSAYIDLFDNDGLTPINISDMLANNGVTLSGVTSDGQLGSVLTAAGDMNGDGFADFVLGSEEGDIQTHYLIFGNAGLMDSAPDLASLDGSNGVQIVGTATRIDSAGDINGDGYDDLILGSPYANETGQGYLIFGQADGWSSSLSLTELDASNGVLIDGITAGDATGDSVAGAGDINGDGIDDLVIGSPQALQQTDWPYKSHGQIHVIYGRRGDWEATFDLAQFDKSEAAAIVGRMDNTLHFGYTLNGVGDMNGDGIDDLMVMEGGYFGRFVYPGYTVNGYLVFGKSEGWDNPWFIGERASGDAVEITVSGALGRNSIHSAGDVNNDGIADMLIGRPTGANFGGASIVFGRSDDEWNAELELTGSGYTHIASGQHFGGIGGSVASIGDINQDGYTDVLLSESKNPTGYTYLLYGRADGWNDHITLYELTDGEGQLIKLNESSSIDVAGVGDVNADGYTDFLIGEPEASLAGIEASGQVHLIFGGDQLFG